MVGRTKELFEETQAEGLCEQANPKLIEVKEFGMFTVSLWGIPDREVPSSERGWAVKFVVPHGDMVYPIPPFEPKVDHLLAGLLWAVARFVEFRWINED